MAGNDLERQGLIEIDHGRLFIRDLKQLESIV